MLCLTCGFNQQVDQGECGQCGAYLGVAAGGGGYLPQLSILQEQLQAAQVTSEVATVRLQRLDQSLEHLLTQVEAVVTQFQRLPLQELKEFDFDELMGPLRQDLGEFRTLVAALSPDGNWSEEAWLQVKYAQLAVLRSQGNLMNLAQLITTKMS